MRRGNHLDQYILAFAVEFRREQADAGGVASGMRERFDQSRRHHVLGHSDERYRVLERLQGKLGTGNDRIGGGVDQRCGLLDEMRQAIGYNNDSSCKFGRLPAVMQRLCHLIGDLRGCIKKSCTFAPYDQLENLGQFSENVFAI